MPEDNDFRELMRRVRKGDEAAAAELVRQYEPTIRSAIRIRLVNARLRRIIDTMDICQSVLASFFVRAALNQYELENPEQLQKLLATMVRNKLADQARQEQRQRRDHRRVQGGSADERDLPAASSSPSQQVAARELLAEFRKRLSPEECRLADQRAEGREWGEIAAEWGESPEALRKRLARAVDRISLELGLKETNS